MWSPSVTVIVPGAISADGAFAWIQLVVNACVLVHEAELPLQVVSTS